MTTCGRGYQHARCLAIGLSLAVALSAFGGLPPGAGAMAAAIKPGPGQSNHFDPTSRARSVYHTGPAQPAAKAPAPPKSLPAGPLIQKPQAVTMKPATLALDASRPSHFTSSDGVLEADVPAGAVTAADVTAAGGSISLLVRQVLPASGSSAGGSGLYTFGTYLVQALDSSGRLLPHGLRRPVSLRLHAGRRGSALDLAHMVMTVNRTLPPWVALDPATVPAGTAAAPAASRAPATPAQAKLGPQARQRPALDATGGTLSATAPADSSSTTFSFDTDAPVATFGKPDPFETNLGGGGLTANFPIEVPAGPGGLTPPLTLAYNSAGVSDQHNPAAAVGWVGEGWNLSLGSISWAEHNVETASPGSTPMWEDSWQLNDPFGTGAELVPPDITARTYDDDTSNPPTVLPTTWHTAPETRDKVIDFTSPNPPPGFWPIPPCFRVFKPNGIMEEFGCTPDSLQFYPQPSGPNTGIRFVANWLLDLITDPRGEQIHVSYQQDMQTGAGGVSYPRDAVMSTVEYDSPGCLNAQTACTGSAWAPLMRTSFAAGHQVAHPLSGSACPANGSLRCDDPIDYSCCNGLAAPTVQNTFVLNDVQVQVRPGAGAPWNTLRDYRLTYNQSPPSSITDPVTGLTQGIAGTLALMQLQEIGSDGSAAMPLHGFGYQQVTQYYEDSLSVPTPASNCGPSWNNGNMPNGHTGCLLWSQSYQGNSWYLNAHSNGLGMLEQFTWQNARNNFHGVVSGTPADPNACNSPSVQSTFPCNMPDDQTWSHVVLVQKSNSVVRSSQAGQGGAQTSVQVTGTTNFSYQVRYPLPAPECTTCVASFYWGNQNSNARLDFYDNRFMGFAQATVSKPDGSVDVHKFLTTEGFGLYDGGQVACNTGRGSGVVCNNDAWWHLSNAAHGHEYELDQYDTNGTTLLKQVLTQWRAICPPAGVSPTPPSPSFGSWDGNLVSELDHANPVMVCDIQKAQQDDYRFDGTVGSSVHHLTSYSYDQLGREVSRLEDGGSPVADSTGRANAGARSAGGVTTGVAGLVNGDPDTAMSFDGATGTVSLNLQGIDTAPGHQVTVEFWMNWSGGGGGDGQIPFAFNGYDLYLLSGVGFGFNTQNGDIYGVGPAAVPVNTPLHVVGVFTNGTLSGDQLYINGVPQTLTQVRSTPNVRSVSTGASISGWPVDSRYRFSGVLDEVAVYNGALPASRVQAHFSAGAGYRSAVLADSPLAYYRLDDRTTAPSGMPGVIVHRTAYVQNDSVSSSTSSATGTYLLDRPALQTVEDPGGSRYQCTYTSYDGQSYTTGQSNGLTRGEATTTDRFTGCGNSANGFNPSGQIRTTRTFDDFGNLLTGSDADANAGIAGHAGCTVATSHFSSCTTYDGAFHVLPTAEANALNQVTTTSYQSTNVPTSIADSSGHGFSANPAGSLGYGMPGLVPGDGDTAMFFDGATAVVTGPPEPALQGDNTRSVELWLQTANGASQRFFNSGNQFSNGQAFNFMLTSSGGVGGSPPVNTPGLEVQLWNDDVYMPGLNLADGRPHHLVVTLSGSTLSAYVDGTTPQGLIWNGSSWSGMVAQPFGLPSTPNTWAGNTEIGRMFVSGVSSYFQGTLDEVAIYDHVLSAARVAAHRSAGSGYRSAVLADSPVAYYRLDDGAGAINPLGGFGLWPTAKTDANGQTTSLTYDALGRRTSETLPGETAGLTTIGTGYTVWCSAGTPQAPCLEVDHTQRLNSGATVTSRGFYDGLGHLVETRTPAPGGQDVVRYSFYDQSGRPAAQSVPYFVAAYSGPPGAAAYSVPDSGQAVTTYSYDGLGRQTSVTDALMRQTTTSRAVACGPAGTTEASCYARTLIVDANGHQTGTLVDAFGRTIYEQRYTGSGPSTYAVYATAHDSYDFLGDLVQILHPDGGTQTTFQYDMAGRKTAMTDPDLGSQSYTYDPDGNLVQPVDARGTAGTTFMGYDGLDRPLWRNTTNSPTGAYVTFSYDSTAGGNQGVGRLTSETFSGGSSNSLSGSMSTVYDARGQVTSSTLGVGSTSYPLTSTYDDAGNVLAQQYPDGETITNSYTPQGWLSGVATQQGVTGTTLLSNVAYGGVGGAFGEVTGASLGGSTYQYSASYDVLDRATDVKVTRSSDSSTVFEQARSFDAVGNVTAEATTLPQGNDNQSFCYDEQDRLTWAGSTGAAPPCTGTGFTPGTLTAAQYVQSFSYDPMGRLTSGPMGSYQYGDPAHVHAATAIGTGYTASYDVAGNMTCRAPSGSSTCVGGSPNGAQLQYDNEGRLAGWQNAPGTPSSSAALLYDGAGQRVAQQVTSGGATSTTVYVGTQEEVTTSGSTTTTTAYYHAGGKRIGLSVNGVISYLASDGLGSAVLSLGSNGTPGESQLFAPYGGVRYSLGTMPTTIGFTGQRSDAVSGLDYYGARYYDPVAGQFASGDSLLGAGILGLSRYAYVQGNPIIRTDPTGQFADDGRGGGEFCRDVGCIYDPGPPPPPDPGPPPFSCDCPIGGNGGPGAQVSNLGGGGGEQPDAPKPPDTRNQACMCISEDPGGWSETIPIDEGVGSSTFITTPGDSSGLDERIVIEGGRVVVLINVHSPQQFGIRTSTGESGDPAESPPPDTRRGGSDEPIVILLGPDGKPVPQNEGPTTPIVGVPQNIQGEVGRKRDLQVEPPTDSKVGIIVWAIARALRGVTGHGHDGHG